MTRPWRRFSRSWLGRAKFGGWIKFGCNILSRMWLSKFAGHGCQRGMSFAFTFWCLAFSEHTDLLVRPVWGEAMIDGHRTGPERPTGKEKALTIRNMLHSRLHIRRTHHMGSGKPPGLSRKVVFQGAMPSTSMLVSHSVRHVTSTGADSGSERSGFDQGACATLLHVAPPRSDTHLSQKFSFS